MITPMSRADIIRRTRRIATQSLADTLRELLPSCPTEAELRDEWLRRMLEHPQIVGTGWYSPPPHGIAVLAGDPPNLDRLNTRSLRPVESWPSDHVRVSPRSLLYAYASPVDRQTGLIGDIAATLYAGSDTALRSHLSTVYRLTRAVAEAAEVGMRLSKLYSFAERLAGEAGLTNEVFSVTDPESVDIGHTVPYFCEPASSQLIAGLAEEEVSRATREAISTARRFLNAGQQNVIGPNSAFTVEPRLRSLGLPTAGFHLIVAFEGGQRQVIEEFEPLHNWFDV